MKNVQDHPVKENNRPAKRYFFILGREAHLAVAELMAVLAKRHLAYEILDSSKEALVLEAEILPQELFAELGGMIKYGECLFEAPAVENFPPKADLSQRLISPSAEALAEKIKTSLGEIVGDKMIFGFSVYALGEMPFGVLKSIKSKLDRFAMVLKKEIKQTARRVRYVTTNELALSSVAVLTNKLMREGGHEFVALARGGNIIFGQTLGVQDFSEFRHRDFGRPARDPKRGTLPPKLARVLINLSGASKQSALLDPFCGDGTVLTEAIALSFSNLIGSDIDPLAVSNTEANTNWCTKEYQHNADIRLFAADARSLSDMLPPQSVDAIVTEGDLGSPLRARLSRSEAERVIESISVLYRETIKVLASLLTRGGRMVLALPHYPTEAGEFGISFDGLSFDELHLAPVDVWPKEVSRKIGRFGAQNSYIYGREDQKVEREIFIFQKM